MDFFEQQERTGRRIAWLAAGFIPCAILTALTSAWFVEKVFVLAYLVREKDLWLYGWHTMGSFYWATVILMFLLISFNAVWRSIRMPDDGVALLQNLGGRVMNWEGMTPKQLELQNVLEEMAIAAGRPVPPLVLLPSNGMNSITAGRRNGQIAIGVTEGSLRRLDRCQLQALLAHELGHIVHGDPKVNHVVLTWIHGLCFVHAMGYRLYCITAVEEEGAPAPSFRSLVALPFLVVGVLLMLAGWVGVFCSSLLTASVSRQQEYRADAAAMQFTRNPLGVKKAIEELTVSGLGGLQPQFWMDWGHMAFVRPTRMPAVVYGLSSHPSGTKRMEQIDWRWDGSFPTAEELMAEDRERETVASSPVQTPAPAPQAEREMSPRLRRR